LVCLILLYAATGSTNPEDKADSAGPEATVERLHRALEAVSEEPADERYNALEGVVLETHNLDRMIQLILSGQWSDFSAEQQKQVMARFRTLSVRDYVSHFEDLDEGQFAITDQRQVSEQRAQVTAQLTTPKREVAFAYTLSRDGNSGDEDHWRIVSIQADGVSELALRRSEYLRRYNADGFQGLLQALEQEAGESGS